MPTIRKDGHRRQYCASLPHVADHAAEGENRSDGDQQQRPDLEKVGPGVGVFERMGGVGVEEAAAVGAELLDDLLAGHRTNRYGLLGAFQGRGVDGPDQGLRHAQGDEDQRPDDRDRQQNVEGDSGQIGPEIADSGRRGAHEATHQREGHGEAGRRRDEIVHGEAEHLGQIAHGRLAGVILPVGVGDEADRGVEGEIGRHRAEAARVQRQHALQPLNAVEKQKAGHGKGKHRDRIGKPALLARRVHPGQAVKAALDRSDDRAEKVAFASVNVGDEFAERYGAAQNQSEHKRDLRPANERHRNHLLI